MLTMKFNKLLYLFIRHIVLERGKQGSSIIQHEQTLQVINTNTFTLFIYFSSSPHVAGLII